MSNKDGIAKNLEVVTDGIDDFRDELKKIDAEVAKAWDDRDVKEYFHKVSAPGPEFFEHCNRLMGCLILPFILPFEILWYTTKNIAREIKGKK